MSTDILMPNLGFDTQEARIVEWSKQPGDSVHKGEIVAIVESDKANVELESVADGVLLEHLFPPDTVVAVGSVIARIGESEEINSQTALSPATKSNLNVSPIARKIATENSVDLSAVVGSGTGGRIMRQDVETLLSRPQNDVPETILALPKVRKAARDAGIDLKAVKATGVSGQITMADLERHLENSLQSDTRGTDASQVSLPPTPSSLAGIQEVSLSRMRQAIGHRLSKSMQDAPHFYVTGEFDLEDALIRLRSSFEPRLRVNDLIQYLTVQTIQRVPELNSTYRDGKLYRHTFIHLSIAVGLDDGLLTPVIPNAERYSLQGMAQESEALIERARSGHLRPDDLREGTFTVSNLGVIKQVEQFTAVINPPQVAILAVGSIKQRPIVLNGGLHVRNTVKLTLSGDHRVVDGLTLGQFMAAFQVELDNFSGRS